MKLKTHHDLEVSTSQLFMALSDTTRWERAALRRGVEVVRQDGGTGLVGGAKWHAKGSWRGKAREVDITLREVAPPHSMAFDFESGLFAGTAVIQLVDLSIRRTRVSLELELKPKTLAARILLQGAKLRKQSIQRRFSQKIGTTLSEMGSRLA